jgi:glycosyltransferase involved in cell wall biosynthesis
MHVVSFKDSLLETANFLPFSLQAPDAWCGHLPFAAWLIRTFEPKTFVELGTHSGNSYFSFCQSVSEFRIDTRCYAVDAWQGDEHAGNYGDEVFHQVNAHNETHYASFSRLLKMKFDDAVSYFSDRSIDLLHIDGLHTYEAVKHDFETWRPKLAPGAVVLFHDTNVRERGFGVWKLWEELKGQYPNNLEFLHSHGLGVLQLGGVPNAKKLVWLEPNSIEQKQLKNYFFALGAKQLEQFELRTMKAHVTNLNQAVTERDGQVANLSQAVAERDAQVASLNQAVAERDAQLASLNQTMADRDAQIAAVYNSTSWQVMAPMRIAGQQVKRARRVAELAIPAIRHGGGLKSAARKAIQLYRREGIKGIKRGFRIIATTVQSDPAVSSSGYDRNNYAEWIRRYDTLTDESRRNMRKRVEAMAQKPLISIVMPTYNPKPEWLIGAIESVRKQIYPYWELCIADDASTEKTTRPILERYAKEDSRIKVAFREKNGHISASSNTALQLVTGEWVALLDHDDLLAEHALYSVADAINQHPDVRLIYSDEDKIDKDCKRFGPYFKCDWNVDLFYSHNLITHLGVYRADILADIGGFREGMEGAQDYDLALRYVEHIKSTQIHHIPRVLYHWRVHAESTAQSSDAKPYAMLAGERALNEHFHRKKIGANAKLVGYGYRISYSLPDSAPMVSLIIPTRNGLQLIRTCVESILEKTRYPNYEILIIDNGSDDPETLRYFDELRTKERVKVTRDDRPFNYSALNNAGVKMARGAVVGLLNNDLEVISPGWLSEMVSIALQPNVGAVGARLWYPNETLQHGGVILGIGGWAGHAHKGFPKGHPGFAGRMSLISGFTAVTGACLIVRKDLYEKLGGLNESDLSVACNDVDFCLRLREAGYRNVWTPYAEFYHYESATRGYEDTPEKRLRFEKELHYMRKRWKNLLLNDPSYNPNLTLDYEDFSLAWPPRVEALQWQPFQNIAN